MQRSISIIEEVNDQQGLQQGHRDKFRLSSECSRNTKMNALQAGSSDRRATCPTQVPPPERYRSQAALFRARVLTDKGETPAETATSIKNQYIIGSAPPMDGQFQARLSRPAN
jgi:hypothetical protein